VIIFFSLNYRLVLGPTQLRVQLIPGVPSPRAKRLELETDHSPPSSTEVKNGRTKLSLLHRSSWRGVY
jgi:hypothetical protein